VHLNIDHSTDVLGFDFPTGHLQFELNWYLGFPLPFRWQSCQSVGRWYHDTHL